MLRHGPEGDFSWLSWHGEPSIPLGLLLLAGLYLLGVGPLRGRFEGTERLRWGRVAAFFLGLMVLFVALYGPLDELSDHYLFSAHMVQHLLLILVAVPLLFLGLPSWFVRPLLQVPFVTRSARWLTHPITALLLFNATLALWHVPTLYEAALRHEGLHIFQHLTLMAAAVLMWWPIFSPLPDLPRLGYSGQLLYLFVLSLPPAIVGAMITFADRVLYPFYAAAPRLWDLSPLVDQQIGGLIMKIPGWLVLFGVFTVVFFAWAHHEAAAEEEALQWKEVEDELTRMGLVKK